MLPPKFHAGEETCYFSIDREQPCVRLIVASIVERVKYRWIANGNTYLTLNRQVAGLVDIESLGLQNKSTYNMFYGKAGDRMTAAVEQALEEMIQAIHEWFDEQTARKDLEQTIQRTKLQMGIFDDIFVLYKPGRTIVDSLDMGWDEGSLSTQTIRFTEELVRTEIQPRLVEVVQEKLAEWADTPLIDYRFTFRGKFPTSNGMLKLTLLEYINEEKRQKPPNGFGRIRIKNWRMVYTRPSRSKRLFGKTSARSRVVSIDGCNMDH